MLMTTANDQDNKRNMIPRFASKEIHFLKTDTENSEIKTPEIYCSDLILKKPSLFRSFSGKLNNILKPKQAFLCAAIRIIPQDTDDNVKNNTNKVFEAVFKQVADKDRGMWQNIDHNTFILGLPRYENEGQGGNQDQYLDLAQNHDQNQAKNIILSIKEILSEEYNCKILTGTAFFPYLNYPKSRIPANAIKALDHAAFFGPGNIVNFDAVSLNISGDRFYHLKHYEPAIKDYKEGLKLKPGDSNMLNSLGVCFAISGELKKAEQSFKSSLKNNPKEAMALYNIGLLHQIKGKEDKAAACLEQAHNTDSSIFEVELLLAWLLFKKQEYKKALTCLNAAEKFSPASAILFRIKGEIFLAKNQHENAASQFNKAIKLNPSDAVSLSGYAECMTILGRNFSIALTFAAQSLQLDPDNLLFKERLEKLRERMQLN